MAIRPLERWNKGRLFHTSSRYTLGSEAHSELSNSLGKQMLVVYMAAVLTGTRLLARASLAATEATGGKADAPYFAGRRYPIIRDPDEPFKRATRC